MNKIHTWLHGRWAVPAISGVAIVASLIADKLGATTVGNILMLAAAVVAGLPIAIKAFRSLMVKHISIDLLVSVAAIGAILVGNFWEAAAVTLKRSGFGAGFLVRVRGSDYGKKVFEGAAGSGCSDGDGSVRWFHHCVSGGS